MRHYMTQTNHSWHEQVRGSTVLVMFKNGTKPQETFSWTQLQPTPSSIYHSDFIPSFSFSFMLYVPN